MRFYKWGFILALVLVSAIARVGAQDVVPTFMPMLEDETTIYTNGPDEYISLFIVSILYDICPELLFEANRDVLPEEFQTTSDKDLIPLLFQSMPRVTYSLTIPPHESCYTPIDSNYKNFAQVEHDYNVCVEAFQRYVKQVDTTGRAIIYLRKDSPPCINENGQRLVYYKVHGWVWVAGDYTSTSWIDAPTEVTDLGYCLEDLRKANQVEIPPLSNSGLLHYLPGMRLFIPETARKCRFVSVETQNFNLYQFSQKHNMCMDVLLGASGLEFPLASWQETQLISIPNDAPSCYDTAGQRLNVPEEMVYKPQAGESLLDIARKHNICMDGLWDANPIMEYWIFVDYQMPEVIFIPLEKPCEFAYTLTVQPKKRSLSLFDLTILTNICMNRLVEVDPDWKVNTGYDFPYTILPEGDTIVLPHRPPCYHLTEEENFRQIEYLCYPVAVTSDMDFTGHVPPVSSSRTKSLPYCYEITHNMTFVYENVRYSTYRQRGYDTYITMGQCLGIDPEALLRHNTQTIPEDARPYRSIYIPEPHDETCWLLTTDDEHYYQRYLLETYKAGYLIDGVYTVNYGETLNSIGRKFGYLPQWIAEANNLSDPYTIYYLQELKLPAYPSLYTLVPVGGAVGVIVLSSSAIYGLRRGMRSRASNKKKNT